MTRTKDSQTHKHAIIDSGPNYEATDWCYFLCLGKGWQFTLPADFVILDCAFEKDIHHLEKTLLSDRNH